MTITELIKELEAELEILGDVEVTGDFSGNKIHLYHK